MLRLKKYTTLCSPCITIIWKHHSCRRNYQRSLVFNPLSNETCFQATSSYYGRRVGCIGSPDISNTHTHTVHQNNQRNQNNFFPIFQKQLNLILMNWLNNCTIAAFVSGNNLILSRLQNSAPYSAIFINLFYLNKSWKVAVPKLLHFHHNWIFRFENSKPGFQHSSSPPLAHVNVRAAVNG